MFCVYAKQPLRDKGLFCSPPLCTLITFNIKANATKLGNFISKTYLVTIYMTCRCPRDLTFPWQPYFDRHVFFKIYLILILNKSFVVAFFSL